MTESALYIGDVMHHRLRPRAHFFRYRVFWLLLDLDEIDGLAAQLRLFSRNRFNALSISDKDYDAGRLDRAGVEAVMRDAGHMPAGGAIRLFTMPRVMGYVFNPLSIYFCYRASGELDALIYEVHNTFGQRHSYFFAVDPSDEAYLHQTCDKHFYVSPFMGMSMTYEFALAQPRERLSVFIRGLDAEGLLISTALHATRTELTDARLLRALIAFPFLTLKVIVAIHWEALRLWLKGTRLQTRPPPPAHPISHVGSASESV